MLKKILAASSAAVVAVSALASTAMAATTDDYTIVIENVNDYKMVTLDLTASLSSGQIETLIGGDHMVAPKVGSGANVAATMYNPADDAENSYANLVLSVWMADFYNLQGRDSSYKIQDRNDGKSDSNGGNKYDWKDVSFNGATIKVDLEANVQKKYMIPVGYELPAGGDWIPSDWNTTHPGDNYPVGGEGLVVDPGRKGGASGYLWDKSTKKLAVETTDNKTLIIDGTNGSVGPEQVSFTKEDTIAKTAAWTNFDSKNSTAGHVVTPTSMKPKFGLNALAWLDEILYNKSSVTVDFSVTMPEYAYYGMMYGTAAQGYYWDWTNTCWRDGAGNKVTNFTEILNGTNARNAINDYFGIVGQSWGSGTNCTGGISAGGLEVKVKNVTAEDVHKVNPLALDAWYRVGLGINATPTRLKNMNNGGTIEFIFKNEIWNGSFLSVETILRSGSGIASVPLQSEFAFAESGKSVSVPFPAGLTVGSDNNPFNSYWLDYIIKGTSWQDPSSLPNWDGSHGWVGEGSNNPTQWNNELVQIVIHANKEAPKDDTSSSTTSSSTSDGGLVSSSTTSSTPASSSTTSSATNSGSNSGEKNPGTGVAVAVAPVVLAATAAAVVISKKRK